MFGLKSSGMSLRYGSEINVGVNAQQKEKVDSSEVELQEFSCYNRNS